MNQVKQASAATRGVIWISGYSCSGKTTVGRLVERTLSAKDIPALFLDGDDLRKIFAERWGYERGDRIELARVYFRLCSYLSAQGFTVILSAVAMYDEVRDWIRANIPDLLEVYLDVPEEERLRRDRATKNVYAKIGPQQDLYDVPRDPDLRIPSFGDVTAEDAAQLICRRFLSVSHSGRTHRGKSTYWEGYYRQEQGSLEASLFARQLVETKLGPGDRLLEVGCGNGRDAAFFASRGIDVVAIDAAQTAIDLCRRIHGGTTIRFVAGDLGSRYFDIEGSFDVVYSRFVLHAMTEQEQSEALHAAYRKLKPGGALHLECRSINDPLAQLGEVVGPTERINGHYRRFIVLRDLLGELERIGFLVEHAVEEKGLAPFGDEDPVMVRVSAAKK